MIRLPQQVAIQMIRCYQWLISPWFPPSCRFVPTCSQYALETYETHGFFRGSYWAFRRLLRCHPFHPGGYDPVPPTHQHSSNALEH